MNVSPTQRVPRSLDASWIVVDVNLPGRRAQGSATMLAPVGPVGVTRSLDVTGRQAPRGLSNRRDLSVDLADGAITCSTRRDDRRKRAGRCAVKREDVISEVLVEHRSHRSGQSVAAMAFGQD